MGTDSNKPSGLYFPTGTIVTVEPPKRGTGVTIRDLLIDFRDAASEQNIKDIYFGEEVRDSSSETVSRNVIKNFKGPSRLYRVETGGSVGTFVESLQMTMYSLPDAIMRMTVLVREGQFAFKDDIPVTIRLTNGKDGKPRALHVRRDTTLSGVLNMNLSKNHDHKICWVNPNSFIMG